MDTNDGTRKDYKMHNNLYMTINITERETLTQDTLTANKSDLHSYKQVLVKISPLLSKTQIKTSK